MDITVVIPTYNRADLLPQTLRAVLEQTLPPRQVIVVDDGSTDATSAVLKRFKPAVTSVRISNSGSIVARNVGLRAANTAWVAFCDSDDLWQPGFLAAMSRLWRAEPAVRVAYGNFFIVRNEVWSLASKFDDAPQDFWLEMDRIDNQIGVFRRPIVDRLLRFQPFFPSACLTHRRAMLDVGGWDEGVGRTVGDDFATVLRMAEHVPFGVLLQPLVGIRKHPGNFSADTRKMNLGDANILDYVLATRPSLTPLAAAIRTSAAQRRLEALDSAFADRDFAAVKAIYGMLPRTARNARTRIKRLLAGVLPG